MNTNPNSSKLVWIFLALNLLASSIAIVLNFTPRHSKDIVYVDAIKLISSYKGMSDAKRNFKSRNETSKNNLDTLARELQLQVAKYERIKQTSTQKERQLMEALIQSKQKQYLDYEQIVKEQYQKNEQELSIQILKEVNDYVKEYGEKEGYTIILAATQAGTIAYGNKSYDITEEVLIGLNSQYKPKVF